MDETIITMSNYTPIVFFPTEWHQLSFIIACQEIENCIIKAHDLIDEDKCVDVRKMNFMETFKPNTPIMITIGRCTEFQVWKLYYLLCQYASGIQ